MMTRNDFMDRCRGTIQLMAVLSLLSPMLMGAERLPLLPNAMNLDPQLTLAPAEYHLPDAWSKLWCDALVGEEEDLRREAAASLLRLHQSGSKINPEVKSSLLRAFRKSQNQLVRHTVAAALVQLDVREAAEDLYEFAGAGNLTVARTIEPALARWKYNPAQEEWLQRVSMPSACAPAHLVLAVEGLTVTNRRDATDQLVQLATDQRHGPDVRMAAASALGKLSEAGLARAAGDLAKDQSPHRLTNRLVAALMLTGHREQTALAVLQALAVDEYPAVAIIALQHLLDVDSSYVHSIATELLKNRDAEIRQSGLRSIADQPSKVAVDQLAGMLNDPHPEVRSTAGRLLLELASDRELKTQILQWTEQILSQEDWRGLEQGCRLAGHLDHETMAEQLLTLLRHTRSEVQISAAWALRMIAVPATLPTIEEFIQQMIAPLSTPGVSLSEREDVCLMHLFETVGQARSQSAVPSLLKCVPKRKDMGSQSRAAAVWALGHIFQDGASDELVQQLIGRMGDADVLNPEYMEVRAAAAISLGRMRIDAAVPPMKVAMVNLQTGLLGYVACEWAIAQITGTPQPQPIARQIAPREPFLKALTR